MNVLFCSSEVFPFAATGGLADVCGSLPPALEKVGVHVAVMMPHYKNIKRKNFPIEKINNAVSKTKLGGTVDVYLVENRAFFERDGLYSEPAGDYSDNLERFHFFCRESLELMKQLNLKPDVIHCHDWQTALIPVYLKTILHDDSFYRHIKSFLTIHNLAYQGIFHKSEYFKLGLPETYFGMDGFEFYGKVNLLKAGILLSDMVTTVSPRYAKEIQTKEFGCGLEGVLHKRGRHIHGVLNGIDYNRWNPETDPYITQPYCAKTVNDKAINKQSLQKECGFTVDADIPLLGFVARLSAQKGIDLLVQVIDDLIKENCQLVLLGEGEKKYQDILRNLSRRYPDKISIHLAFDESRAHRIYAGSDIFLMPSHYEPCGLSQMISLCYGTIPVVFKTGGLADTIVPFNPADSQGNGFIFTRYERKDFMKSLETALKIYRQKKDFKRIIKNAFSCNFSWEKAAKEYQHLYKECLQSG